METDTIYVKKRREKEAGLLGARRGEGRITSLFGITGVL